MWGRSERWLSFAGKTGSDSVDHIPPYDWPRSLSENQIYQIMGMLVLPHRSGIGPGPLPLSLGQQVALILSTMCGRKIFTEFHRERGEAVLDPDGFSVPGSLGCQKTKRTLHMNTGSPARQHAPSPPRPAPPLRRMAPTPFELVVVEPYRRLQSSQDQGDLGNTVRRCTATAHAAAPRGCRTFP